MIPYFQQFPHGIVRLHEQNAGIFTVEVAASGFTNTVFGDQEFLIFQKRNQLLFHGQFLTVKDRVGIDEQQIIAVL